MRANVRQTFVTDAQAGALPDVSWVYAPRAEDFHTRPGTSMSASDTWLGSAVNAVAQGADWARVAIFVTFDDRNPDAARRTAASDEKAMADCIDASQAPLPPSSVLSGP